MALLAKFISAEPSLAYRKPISRLLFLRTVSIAFQLLTVIVMHFSIGTHDYIGALLLIIAFETLFHLSSIVYFARLNATNFALALQILADISFLSLLLFYSGGATNAFEQMNAPTPISIGLMPNVSVLANLLGYTIKSTAKIHIHVTMTV